MAAMAARAHAQTATPNDNCAAERAERAEPVGRTDARALGPASERAASFIMVASLDSVLDIAVCAFLRFGSSWMLQEVCHWHSICSQVC